MLSLFLFFRACYSLGENSLPLEISFSTPKGCIHSLQFQFFVKIIIFISFFTYSKAMRNIQITNNFPCWLNSNFVIPLTVFTNDLVRVTWQTGFHVEEGCVVRTWKKKKEEEVQLSEDYLNAKETEYVWIKAIWL